MLGSTRLERDAVIARMLYIGESHWDDMLRLSRRSEDGWRTYADKYGRRYGDDSATAQGCADWADDDSARAKNHGARMMWLNLTNDDTVELRIPRGTLRTDTFLATVDMALALVGAAKGTMTEDCGRERTLRDILTPYATDELLGYKTERGL
jgi:hypothetical protein